MNPAEELALRHALASGILNAEQIQAARAHLGAAPPGTSVLGLLRNQLTPAQVAELSQVYQQALTSGIDHTATLVPNRGPRPGIDQTATLVPNRPGHTQTAVQHATHGVGPGSGAAQGQPSERLGPYQIVRELARGGMGVVYVARREGMEREVALKVLLAGDEANLDEVQRFMAEVKITSRLEHPNVIRISDTGQEEGKHYFVMDLVDGPSLDSLVKDEGPLEPRRAAEITAKLARALAYAHGRAVLHRDLKPHNVLLRADGEPILTDFGIAKDVAAGAGLTQDGDLVGTPAYMPPEQTGGELETIDRRSDVYSLGATLFHLIVGRAPFEGDSVMSLITRVLRDEAPSPRSLRDEVDLDLDTIVLKCLEKEQSERYPTMTALAEDLERYVRDEPISARPPGFTERLRKWVRRNRALATVSAAAAVVLLVGTGAAGVWVARAERAKRAAEVKQQQEAERVQAGLVREARARAEESQAKVQVPDSESLAALSPEERSQQIDRALSASMRALQDAQLWRGLAPADADATRRAIEAGRQLGEVALLGEQWSLAAEAFEQARALDPDAERAQRDVDRVQGARTAEARRQLEAVAAILARAKQGELRREPRGLESAVFALIRYPQVQTVELLSQELAGVTKRLATARRELFLEAARPTPLEARAGVQPIPELAAAVDRLLGRDPLDPAPLSASDARALKAARTLLKNRSKHGVSAELAFERILALRQQALPPGVTDLGRLCARALGRLGRAEACAPLAAYLDVVGIEEHATEAAFSLITLGDPRGIKAVQRGRTRFSRGGPYVYQMSTTVGLPGSGEHVERLDLAHGFLRRNEGQKAFEILQKLVREAPDRVEVQVALAQAYLQTGRPRKALEAAQRAEKLSPRLVAPSRLQAAVYRLQGDYEQAARFAREAISRDPQDPQSHAELGWVLLQSEGPERARAKAKEALAIDERCSDAQVLLGMAYLLSGELAKARTWLEKAHRDNPSHFEALTGLARVEMATENFEAALALADKALALHPNTVVGRTLRGEVLSYLGRGADAERELTEALRIFPNSTEALSFRGYVRSGLGRQAEAEADFKRATALEPKTGHHWMIWGNALSKRGDHLQAAQRYTEALKREPDNPETLINRGEAFRVLRRYPEAERDLRRALELRPDNEGLLYGLIVVIQSAGDIPRTAPLAERLIELAPNHPRALLARGLVKLVGGDFAAAERDCARAVKLNPADALAWHRLGTAQLMGEKLKEAYESLGEALKRNPRDPDTWMNRGKVLVGQSKHEAAVRDFDQAIELAPQSGARWDRALSLMHLGRAEQALADFAPLARRDTYSAIWIAGVSGDTKILLPHAKRPHWIGWVARYYLDQVDEAKLLEVAASNPKTKAGYLCEAHAYIALRAEREGDKAKALKHYRASVATGQRTFAEFVWAKSRVAALSK